MTGFKLRLSVALVAAFASAAAAQTDAPTAPLPVIATPTQQANPEPQEPAKISPLPPEENPALVLTWEDCVALAARKNPTLIAADWAKDSSHAAYLSSYNGLLPSATLSNTWTHNNNAGGAVVGSSNLYTGQINANYTVFSMSQVANIRSAKASYNQSLANQRQASATLRYNLLAAFANVYFNQQSLWMNQSIVAIQEKNADEVTLRYEAGAEYKGNMMNAKAQLLVAQINVFQAIRSLRASVKQLDQYLGLDEFQNVIVTGTLVAQTPPNLPTNLGNYLEDRPDVALQEAVVQTAKASVASSEAPLFPTISANYSRFREGGTEFPSSFYLWSAGAQLSLPIFGGGPFATVLNIKSSKENLYNQQQTLRAVRLNALENLENTWASYANAVDQAIGEQAVLESYRQRNTEGGVRYAAGLLTFDNWQVIVTQWVGAEQTAISNWQSAVTSQAAWEQALGTALGE